MKLTPADYVIKIFGGVRATARTLNRTPSTISKWRHYQSKYAPKGTLPSNAIPQILKKAQELQLDITAEDLIEGREVVE
jgi:transposase-like protein